jgi:adenosylcobinamide-GDP ribazoletransferase
MLDSMLMAFSLYSRIPVPQAKWNDRSMRWCLCFLPLVGAVIGAVQLAAYTVLVHFSFGTILRGAVLTALPILLTGGIHMDGYLDTCDAVHSYGNREKRLEILKDPHVGAFAVIGGIVYFVLDFGIWSEAGTEEIPMLCLLFVLSRALSAFTAVTFPKAKKDGMLRQETDPASGKTAAAMAVTALAACAALVFLNRTGSAANTGPGAAAFPFPAVCAIAAALAALLYYRHMAMKDFGGTTGDLSGWFTQTCELVTAAAVVIAFRCT